MKILTALFLLSFLAVFNSCNKKEFNLLGPGKSIVMNSSGTGSEALAEFFGADADGNFFISTSTHAGDDYTGGNLSFTVMGNITDIDNNERLPFGNLQIGSSIVPVTSTYEYNAVLKANYAGQEVDVSLMDASNSSTEFSQTLYFPKPFNYTELNVPNPLKAGNPITWNADYTNSKGLLICIQYNMGDLNNPQSHFDGFEERYIYIEDDGSYTFSTADLAGFNTISSGSNSCKVSLIRGDYAMVYNSSNSTLNSKLVFSVSSPWIYTESD